MDDLQKELDMDNRDPNDLNKHVQTAFEDVIGEPDGSHSPDCVWRISAMCFKGGKACCYTILTGLCGIFIGLYWGCEFACISFEQIWCTTPMLRVFGVYLGCLQKFFGTCVSCCLAPICETCGLLFSNISVKKC
ncbi:caveolin-3-like [Crassostrea angulata]|uniref:Caveolin n=3 Tax=Magallana gigas TaxID=29159 RepID=A0A8W8LSJ2_MAGGI|nr:caveolin-3 [Crassostrea gigas]XP_052679604.1 caveolin-3-like [Crassostrea angulata]